MNKKSLLVIGVVVLVALGVWFYVDSREDVGLGPSFEPSAKNVDGYACYENGKIRNSKTPCHLGLEDFPGMFFDNEKANVDILYSTNLVLAPVLDLATSFADYLYEQDWEDDPIGENLINIYLESEYLQNFDVGRQNLVLVAPIWPEHQTSELFENFNLPNIQEDESLLKISMVGDKYVLIVSGWSTDDVQAAMNYLLYENNNLQGTEIIF